MYRQTITPECRDNRTNQGAWDEAVERLWYEYVGILSGWEEVGKHPTVTLTLAVERHPEETRDPWSPPPPFRE